MDPSTSVLSDYTPPERPRDRVWLHVGLFLATFVSMVGAGGILVARDALWEAQGWTALATDGLWYAVPFLTFLTVHEFGHYLMARRHGVDVSLPYYIPVPLPSTLGTFGAVIRIREPIHRTTHLFDIGAAGPLAGAVVALVVYLAGVLTLPDASYLAGMTGHEATRAALEATGAFPAFDRAAYSTGSGMAFLFGDTLLTHWIAGLGPYRVPPHEVMHYPLLLAGWLGLFFTALNLLPVGQLDGGHVVYALFGPRVHAVVARVAVGVLLISAVVGTVAGGAASLAGFGLDLVLAGWALWAVVGLVVAGAVARLFDGDWRLVGPGVAVVLGLAALLDQGLPGLAAGVGWSGWWLWIGLLLFLVRVDHPPVHLPEALTPSRRVLGYLCIALFVLTFSLQPIEILGG